MIHLVAGVIAIAFGAQIGSGQGVAPNGSEWEQLPCVFNGSSVLVQVGVRGNPPVWFTLDTGAPHNAMDAGYCKEHGVSDETSLQPKDRPTSPEQNLPVTMGNNSTILYNVQIIQIPETFSVSIGHHVDGVLGYEFFREWVVRIDYHRRKVWIAKPTMFHYAGKGTIVPLIINQYAAITAVVATEPNDSTGCLLLLDTGADQELVFSTGSPRLPKWIPAQAGPYRLSFPTMAGNVSGSLGWLSSVCIGNVVIHHAAFSLLPLTGVENTRADGVVGGRVLERFDVTIDYERHRLILEPTASADAPFGKIWPGFIVQYDETKMTAMVTAVLPGSPAAEAGVHPNDRITAIDGAAVVDTKMVTDVLGKDPTQCIRYGVLRGERKLDLVLPARLIPKPAMSDSK